MMEWDHVCVYVRVCVSIYITYHFKQVQLLLRQHKLVQQKARVNDRTLGEELRGFVEVVDLNEAVAGAGVAGAHGTSCILFLFFVSVGGCVFLCVSG
jgi:hypothetical protein